LVSAIVLASWPLLQAFSSENNRCT